MAAETVFDAVVALFDSFSPPLPASAIEISNPCDGSREEVGLLTPDLHAYSPPFGPPPWTSRPAMSQSWLRYDSYSCLP